MVSPWRVLLSDVLTLASTVARVRHRRFRKVTLGAVTPMRTLFLPRYLIHELASTFRPVYQESEINSGCLEREEWFAVREVARLECGVVPMSFLDVTFCWHRENAILPIGFLPGLARESGHDLTESDVCSDQGSLASIASLGYASNHGELPTYQMRPVVEGGFASGFRSFCLGFGHIRMALSFNVVMDHGFLAVAGICAAQLVKPWILFATQFGLLSCLEMKAQRITRRTSSWRGSFRCHRHFGSINDCGACTCLTSVSVVFNSNATPHHHLVFTTRIVTCVDMEAQDLR